jgi:hypothetical protein
MTEDTVTVRVAGGEFRYDGEQYVRGDELEVHERAAERHPRTLERVEENEGSQEDENDAEAAGGETGTLPFNPEAHTNDELAERVAEIDDTATLVALRNLEAEQKDRAGAKEAIDARLNELED